MCGGGETDWHTYWYNYMTSEYEEYEYRQAPTTDEEAKQLISQGVSAQALYDLLRAPEYKGLDILEAMAEVLEAMVGAINEEK